jgi:branched-subunit amino acid transport protein AzlD
MVLSPIHTVIIILMVTIGTMFTRFLPFILFRKAGSNKGYIDYLGTVLPYSAIGLLVVYCLKDVDLTGPTRGIPEGIAILIIAGLHYWKENPLVSIGVGTAVYMLLIQTVFA